MLIKNTVNASTLAPQTDCLNIPAVIRTKLSISVLLTILNIFTGWNAREHSRASYTHDHTFTGVPPHTTRTGRLVCWLVQRVRTDIEELSEVRK